MRSRAVIVCLLLTALTVLLFVVDLATGSVDLTIGQVVSALTGGKCPVLIRRIVIDIRLIKAIVALLAGAALSLSGLQMQTLFRNPLAGPYVLGISSGASLGVALLILGGPVLGLSGFLSDIGVAGAAWLGAAAVLAVIGLAARRIGSIMVILVLGMMFSSAIGALVQVLQYLSNEQSLKAFVIWTMGSLADVTYNQLWILLPAVIAGIVLGVIVIKPLNLMLLGDVYATTLGLDLRRWRSVIFLSTTLLAGSVTAFCGPIGFIGLAIPHVARWLVNSSDHRRLVPATILAGASLMLVCDILSKAYALPINAVTSLAGIPIVVWIVISIRN